jgi:hypothetical protein
MKIQKNQVENETPPLQDIFDFCKIDLVLNGVIVGTSHWSSKKGHYSWSGPFSGCPSLATPSLYHHRPTSTNPRAMDFGLLYVLLGRTHGLRVSMHANDATIFLTPSDQDVTNLTF